MNERTQVSAGLILLIFGSVVVFLYALPLITIPAILVIFATLGMSAGTLLVGTSKETV